MARERVTLSKTDVEEIIKDFCADAQPKIYRSPRKTKEPAAKEQPEFDVDSINLNIIGDEDDTSSNKEISVPSDNEVTNATDMAKVTEATDATKVNESAEIPEVKSKVSTDEAAIGDASDENSTSAPTVKPTRISAKMRRATRAEFCAAYVGKVNTKGGKPIAILPTIMDRLYRLCNLSGDRNACPTYIINNLLSEFLDAVEPEAKKWGALD